MKVETMERRSNLLDRIAKGCKKAKLLMVGKYRKDQEIVPNIRNTLTRSVRIS
jgi:hypothetical protein